MVLAYTLTRMMTYIRHIHSEKIKGTNLIHPDRITGIGTILEKETSPKTGIQDLLMVAEKICLVMILMDPLRSLTEMVGILKEMAVIGRVLKILMVHRDDHLVIAEGPEETAVVDHPGSLLGMVEGLEEMTVIGIDSKTGSMARES